MTLLIFDCDGVLIESEILYQEIQMQALADVGLNYEKNTYVSRFMGVGNEVYYSETSKDYREKFGKDMPSDFRPNLKKRLQAEFKTRLEPVKGMHDMLSSLPQKMVVASSSEYEFLKVKLAQTNLGSFFDPHIYSADFVERAKPHPDLFLYTAEKLETTPDKCVVIEDSENGVKAGLAANMHVIGFSGASHCGTDHANKLKAAGANEVANDIEMLKDVLLKHA